MRTELERLADWMRAQDDVAVIAHVSPDGDTLGSALALEECLRRMGKRACTLCQDVVPRMYHFMPGAREVLPPERAPFVPRALLFSDVSDHLRAGRCLMPEVGAHALIDHHSTNPGFCQVNCVDGGAAATSVMVVELMDAMGMALTPTMAENLYVGITTDTGNYNFRSTDGRTLRAGAVCLDAGADPDKVTRLMFRLRSVARTRLLGAAISGMELSLGGQIAVFRIPRAMMDELGASGADCEGIVNYGTETEGVRAAVMLRERSDGIKASLRSMEDVDVSRVAVAHGGGGHAQAAGCTLSGTMDECAALMVDELTAEIERASHVAGADMREV